MWDLYNDVKVATSIKAQNISGTATVNGNIIDLAGFESAAMVFNVGTNGDAWSGALYYTLKLQHGNDSGLSDAADVSGSDLQGTNIVLDATTKKDTSYKLGYQGAKRYIRAVVTITGTMTTGTPIGATLVQGSPRHAPVA